MATSDRTHPSRWALPLSVAAQITCSTCVKELDAPKRCSGCLRTAYCSSACQTISWSQEHKYVCKAFREVNKLDQTSLKRTHQETWMWYHMGQAERQTLFATVYKRPDVASHLGYILYQPYCVRCFRTEYQLEKPIESLRACRRCKVSFECSTCAAKPGTRCKHPEVMCEFLREYAIMESFNEGCQSSDVSASRALMTPDEVYIDYVPLSTARNWREYFVNVSNLKTGSLFVNEDFQLLPEHLEDRTALEVFRHFKMIASGRSMPLTVVAALEKCYAKVEESQTLSLHFVEATFELALKSLFILEEIILHHFPGLKELVTYLICPELSQSDLLLLPDEVLDSTKADCPSCRELGKMKRRKCIAGTYDSFVSSPEWVIPDLAVVSDSARFREDVIAKSPSVQVMIDKHIKTLFTHVDDSAIKRDIENLQELGAEFILRCTENIWRSIDPLLIPDYREDEQYRKIYKNHYFSIMGRVEEAKEE